MRPVDEGMIVGASLSRMVDSFQRDTGISSSFTVGEFADPAATEVALELLQIVRETLHNIHKHSGASRVAVSAARRESRLGVTGESKGSGVPLRGVVHLGGL